MLETLVEAATRTLLLASMVQTALWLMRIRQARLLLAAWTVVLVTSIFMPVMQRQTPFPLLPSLEPSASLVDVASGMLPARLPPGPIDDANALSAPASLPTSWVISVYLVVCAGMLLRVMLGLGLCCRLLVRAVPIRSDWTQGARVRISPYVTGPVTIANVILMPIGVLAWPADVRLAVLAHEQAHVARHDFTTLTASQLNRCLFWFSPLSWWLHRRLVGLTERASDDVAIAISGNRLRYAEILLQMARHAGPVSQGLAMARPATLADRIDRILLGLVDPRPVHRARLSGILIAGASLSVVAAGVIPRSAQIPSAAPEMMIPLPDNSLSTEVTADPPAFGKVAAIPQAVNVSPAPETTPTQRAREVTPEQSASLRPASLQPGPAVGAVALAGSVSAPAGQHPPRSGLPIAAAARLPQATVRPARAVQTTRGDAGLGPAATTERLLLPTAGADGAGLGPSVSIPHAIRLPGAVVPPLPVEFQGLIGSTCAGAVIIGANARIAPDHQPDVVAGQRIAAHASFYTQPNGTAWVRFNAFGQQPLDLPLRFNQYGLTWTGEHGITYTVRPAAGGRLAGLAGFLRNDSATVDLTCW